MLPLSSISITAAGLEGLKVWAQLTKVIEQGIGEIIPRNLLELVVNKVPPENYPKVLNTCLPFNTSAGDRQLASCLGRIIKKGEVKWKRCWLYHR